MRLTLKRVNLYLTRIKTIGNYFMKMRGILREDNVKLYEVTCTILKAEQQLRELQQGLVKREVT